MTQKDITMRHHSDGELWSEMHLHRFGEMISGLIRDGIEPEYWSPKLIKLRTIYKIINRENDEIALITGEDRVRLRTERFVFISAKIN